MLNCSCSGTRTWCCAGTPAGALCAIFAGLALVGHPQVGAQDIGAGLTLRVLHGKGDKPRTVGLDAGALDAISRWLDRRRGLGLARNGAPLFCTLDGGKVLPGYVRDMLKRQAAKAGLEKRVHPHGLRHTHAAELVREAVPMPVIRDQLGHSSLAVTDRYLRDIAPGEVIAMGKSRTWAAPEPGGKPAKS